MKSAYEKLSLYFETVPERMRRRRWMWWLFFILITVAVSSGVSRNRYEMTIDSWFSEDDPVKVSLDRFRDEFGSDDGIYIVYKPKDGDVFSAKSLALVRSITAELLNEGGARADSNAKMLQRITDVRTLVNAKVLHVDGDSLVSKRLIGNEVPTNAEDREAVRRLALAQKKFPLLYFSEDSTYGGIYIETDFGTIPLDAAAEDEESQFEEFEEDETAFSAAARSRYKTTDSSEYVGFMKVVDEILGKQEYADHFEYYKVGNAPLVQANMKIMREMGPMFAGMLLIMTALLWFLFRSLSAVVWPVLLVVITTVWMMGLSGFSGFTLTSMLMLSIMLVLAVGIADSIHILSAYLHFRNHHRGHTAALRAAYRKAALPCLLTTATTMVGLLALVLAPIKHIQTFGCTSAMGIGLAFVISIYWLPLMIDLWSPVTKNTRTDQTVPVWRRPLVWIKGLIGTLIPNLSRLLPNLLEKVLPAVEKHPKQIIVLFSLLLITAVFGATRARIDTNLVEQVKQGHPFRTAYEIVDRHMMGSQNLEIFLDLGETDALKDPLVLRAMEKLEKKVKDEYGDLVVRTSSLVDVVKETYRVLNENREEMYIIPGDRRTVAQTLFLFDNANPDDRRKLVSDDYAKSHIGIQLHNAGSHDYTLFFDAVRRDTDSIFASVKSEYPEMKITVTGGLALMMELGEYVTWSQLKSFSLTLLVISAVLIVLFGSWRVGLLSVVPNLLPATLTFGLLGLFDLSLDAKTMVVAPVIIGIAVDDTIHFITHYRSELSRHGDLYAALQNTVMEVGQAITFTSLILGLGFFIMAFSTLTAFIKIGVFGALAILTALLCDLFLLPALIIVFKPRFADKAEEKELVSG